jgi:hypothetical protein
VQRFAGLSAAILFPLAAYGSFGGGGPCKDFLCYFLFWGGLLGAAGGIPASALAFVVLHLWFRHRARSKGRQAILGALLGIVAFEISAACASLVSLWGKGVNPWLGFAAAYVAVAIGSVLYVRSNPPAMLKAED